MVKWMPERWRWGLRAQMAASYVLVTAAAVVVVEAVMLAVVVPGLPDQQDPRSLLVRVTARDIASSADEAIGVLGRLPDPGQFPIGEAGLRLPPGRALATADGDAV